MALKRQNPGCQCCSCSCLVGRCVEILVDGFAGDDCGSNPCTIYEIQSKTLPLELSIDPLDPCCTTTGYGYAGGIPTAYLSVAICPESSGYKSSLYVNISGGGNYGYVEGDNADRETILEALSLLCAGEEIDLPFRWRIDNGIGASCCDWDEVTVTIKISENCEPFGPPPDPPPTPDCDGLIECADDPFPGSTLDISGHNNWADVDPGTGATREFFVENLNGVYELPFDSGPGIWAFRLDYTTPGTYGVGKLLKRETDFPGDPDFKIEYWLYAIDHRILCDDGYTTFSQITHYIQVFIGYEGTTFPIYNGEFSSVMAPPDTFLRGRAFNCGATETGALFNYLDPTASDSGDKTFTALGSIGNILGF